MLVYIKVFFRGGGSNLKVGVKVECRRCEPKRARHRTGEGENKSFEFFIKLPKFDLDHEKKSFEFFILKWRILMDSEALI